MIRRTAVFYIFTFVFTIIIGGSQESSGLSPELFILPQLAPGIAALLMVLIFRKEGFKLEFNFRNHKMLLLALVLPAASAVIIAVLNTLVLRIHSMEKLSGIPWTMVIWMPFGALGEELGWRGYLQKTLSQNKTPLFGAVVTGVLWAAWHVGIYRNGFFYFLFFILLMVSYSIVLGSVCAPGFNIVAAALFHFMINFSNLFSFSSISSEDFMIVSSLVWAAIALFVLRRTRQAAVE